MFTVNRVPLQPVLVRRQHRNVTFDSNDAKALLTKIVCTLGPASRSVEMLEKMMAAGMSVARLNFSHGSHEYHAESIKNVREAGCNFSKRIGGYYPIAVALDTKGPEIRTGLIEGSGTAEVELKKGETIKLSTSKNYEEKGNKDCVYVDYANIVNVVKPGNRVFLDDGLISLVVQEVSGTELVCLIRNGGNLGSKKGVNLPGVPIDLPAVSQKDIEDLKFGVDQCVDMVFASFIRDAAAIESIRDILREEGRRIKIIAKIENQQGIENIDDIIAAADGIMVARGDMGIEIPAEKVFTAQKVIIQRCSAACKPVICATQMLESMITKPRPTRAEVTDVGNAVWDGASSCMLSGETAKGKFPLEAVETMVKICKEAEASLDLRCVETPMSDMFTVKTDALYSFLCTAICATHDPTVAVVIVVVSDPNLVLQLSKYQPRCPVILVTFDARVAREAQLWRGVYPFLYEIEQQNEEMETALLESKVLRMCQALGLVKCNDLYVFISEDTRNETCCLFTGHITEDLLKLETAPGPHSQPS